MVGLAVAGKLVTEWRPRLGTAGCLTEEWDDPEGMSLLAALDGGTPYAWDATADGVRLVEPVLGIALSASRPEGLKRGIEYLAAAVDQLLPHCGSEGVENTAHVLATLLRRHFATRPASAPLEAEFSASEFVWHPPRLKPQGQWPWLREPRVEDHRPYGSAIEKALRQAR